MFERGAQNSLHSYTEILLEKIDEVAGFWKMAPFLKINVVLISFKNLKVKILDRILIGASTLSLDIFLEIYSYVFCRIYRPLGFRK